MTFDLPLAQVDARRLESLRDDSVREGRQLDYKEVLPTNSDDDKREFLSDVTSFANSAGGDLIFGLRERRDGEGKPTGEIDAIVGLPGLNVDTERLRLEAMIRDGAAPRMPPVTFHEVSRGSEPPCLVLRILRSWIGLHMVTYKNYSRFFARASGGKYQLDVHEIRAGFVGAEMAYERLRRFRAERVAAALALETPAFTAEGPKLIFHALPLGAIAEEVWERIVQMQESQIGMALPLFGGTPATWRFNLDGFVVHTLRDDPSRQCYTQLFRDGGIEVLSGGALVKDDRRGGFYAWGMEQTVINGFAGCQRFWRAVGVTPPLLIGLTLAGVKGWKVLRGPFGFDDLEATLGREVVGSPEAIVSDLAAPVDIVLRPLFDFIWNGGGWRGSPNYRDGRWVPPQ